MRRHAGVAEGGLPYAFFFFSLLARQPKPCGLNFSFLKFSCRAKPTPSLYIVKKMSLKIKNNNNNNNNNAGVACVAYAGNASNQFKVKFYLSMQPIPPAYK